MTRNEAVNELKCAIDLIKQDGKDWLDERDITLLQMAIKALERKNGKWIPHETQISWGDGTTDVTIFRCSVCGYEEQDWQSKFCSKCGADMRGDTDESK